MSWGIFEKSSHSLTDGFDVKDISAYQQTIEKISGVSRLKDIKARYLGSTVYVDVAVEVSADLNITESHDIVNEIERRMKEEHAIDYSHVHMEPLEHK